MSEAAAVVEEIAVSPPEPVVPPPAASEPPATEPEGPKAAAFAALTRREKELTLREKSTKESLAAKEAELEKRAAEITGRAEQLGSLDGLLKLAREKPTEFFKKTGLTYQQLTEAVLSEGQPPTADDRVAKLEAELAADRAERAKNAEQAKLDAAAAARAQDDRAIEAFKGHVSQFVKANAETYELVAAEDATDLVYDVVEAYYAEHKQVLTVEQAAERVEVYLEAEARKKYSGSKKLASLFQPPPPPPAATLGAALANSATPAAGKKPTPTLTSKTGASGVATPPPAAAPQLTPREIAAKFSKKNRARNAGA